MVIHSHHHSQYHHLTIRVKIFITFAVKKTLEDHNNDKNKRLLERHYRIMTQRSTDEVQDKQGCRKQNIPTGI